MHVSGKHEKKDELWQPQRRSSVAKATEDRGERKDSRGFFARIDKIHQILKTEHEGREGFHAETRRRGEGENREERFHGIVDRIDGFP